MSLKEKREQKQATINESARRLEELSRSIFLNPDDGNLQDKFVDEYNSAIKGGLKKNDVNEGTWLFAQNFMSNKAGTIADLRQAKAIKLAGEQRGGSGNTTDTTSGANLRNGGNGAAGATNVAASAEGAGSASLGEKPNSYLLEQPTETTEQTTKTRKSVEIPAAQQAAANAALQGAGQPAQPSQPAEEPSWRQPIRDIADIDARFTRMLEDDAKADREREEKRINRQLAARSLSDLGGVFTDMIKASQGARVDPRKVEQHYQRMDDNTRKVFDAYRTRMDLARKIAADGAKEDLRRRQGLADKAEERAFQLDLWNRQRKAREADAEADRKARLRIANITHGYGGGNRKPEDEYFIDFGNGETKDYRENTKEGKNVFAAICQYLLSNGYIPEEALMDKDGNIVPVKTQAQADLLVRMYMPYAMTDPIAKSAIYKIVMGKDKDFRDPLRRNIDEHGAVRTTPSWQWVQIPGDQPAQPTGGTKPQNQTSSGSLY